ncbi:hypothetical protein V5N11_001991 [Cardamine amara subsp. amara]|uniref:Uncharacterized protein n=1 Tax=Cardamine amara subsp. amara TaxID=228776 RepID=A0ABD1ABK4_CARAN
MFGSFSFINVGRGKEEFCDGHSPKNMVEVAIISNLSGSIWVKLISESRTRGCFYDAVDDKNLRDAMNDALLEDVSSSFVLFRLGVAMRQEMLGRSSFLFYVFVSFS